MHAFSRFLSWKVFQPSAFFFVNSVLYPMDPYGPMVGVAVLITTDQIQTGSTLLLPSYHPAKV